jgi:hypothetical protein
MTSREKRQKTCFRDSTAHFLQCRLNEKTCRIAAILSDSCGGAVRLLCGSDWVAERVEFESEQRFNPKDPTCAHSQALQSTNMRSERSEPNSTSESGGDRGTFLAEVQEVLGIANPELVAKLIARAAETSQIGGVKEPKDCAIRSRYLVRSDPRMS